MKLLRVRNIGFLLIAVSVAHGQSVQEPLTGDSLTLDGHLFPEERIGDFSVLQPVERPDKISDVMRPIEKSPAPSDPGDEPGDKIGGFSVVRPVESSDSSSDMLRLIEPPGTSYETKRGLELLLPLSGDNNKQATVSIPLSRETPADSSDRDVIIQDALTIAVDQLIESFQQESIQRTPESDP